MPARVAIVGRQFGSRVLAKAFADAGAHIVGLAGGDDWKDLVRLAGIDAVAISVPGGAQKAVALEALKAGKAIFCEKPLAENLDSAREIAAAARRSKRPAVIDFEFPETTAWTLAEKFSHGKLGRLRHASIVWQIETYANVHRTNNWKRRNASGGGTLNNFGSHLFHNVEWLFGRITEISARVLHDGPGDVSAEMILSLKNGATVSVSLAADAFLGSGHRLEAYGSTGSFILDNPHADYMTGWSLRTATRKSPKWKLIVKGRAAFKGEDGRIKPISRLAKRFLEAVAARGKAEPSVAAGLRAQTLIDAARRSDRLKRAVKVPHGR